MNKLLDELNSLSVDAWTLDRFGDTWELSNDDMTVTGTAEQIEAYLLEQISKAKRA